MAILRENESSTRLPAWPCGSLSISCVVFSNAARNIQCYTMRCPCSIRKWNALSWLSWFFLRIFLQIYIYIYIYIFFNLYDRIQTVSSNKFASMTLGPHANFISYTDYNAARVREIDTWEFKQPVVPSVPVTDWLVIVLSCLRHAIHSLFFRKWFDDIHRPFQFSSVDTISILRHAPSRRSCRASAGEISPACDREYIRTHLDWAN